MPQRYPTRWSSCVGQRLDISERIQSSKLLDLQRPGNGRCKWCGAVEPSTYSAAVRAEPKLNSNLPPCIIQKLRSSPAFITRHDLSGSPWIRSPAEQSRQPTSLP